MNMEKWMRRSANLLNFLPHFFCCYTQGISRYQKTRTLRDMDVSRLLCCNGKSHWRVSICSSECIYTVRVHDIHCGPKSYKFKLSGKLVIQLVLYPYLMGGHMFQTLPHQYFLHWLSPKQAIYFPNLLNSCKPKGGYIWGRVLECMIFIVGPNLTSLSF